MEAANLGSGNRIGTVVFVDIVRYSQESVARQAEIKASFGAVLAAVLEDTPAADRIVLDTGDGAALCFLGDPEDALFTAHSLRSRVQEAPGLAALALRIGINLGPVRMVKDINGHVNVIGDGINVAQRVMSFAAPSQILVSRSYFEVVSRLAPDYEQLFQYAGLHRDKHVRDHALYEVQLAPPSHAARAAPEPGASAGDAPDAAAEALLAGKPTARLDPRVLDQVTSALAREIGPVATLIVTRAAQRAADERALAEMLAAHVPPPSRAAFLSGLEEALAPSRGTPESAGTPAPRDVAPRAESPARRDRSIDADVLAQAERMLTLSIGPVARVLVRQASKSAANARELFESLAVHIDDPERRRAFMREAEPLT